jgi:DNA-binding transcriptional ArsR family regulator
MKSPAARPNLVLDALGNPTRREMLRLLARRELAVGQLAAKLPVSRPAVSKHLQVLEQAGLVMREARGNRNYCRLQSAGFQVARAWLDSFWDDALARYKLVAENTAPRRQRG